MVREAEDNVPVTDHFPVFELDGYSKRSGLLQSLGDFGVTAFYEGTQIGVSIAITEIGVTGEYKVVWSPPYQQLGYYQIQVLIALNKDIWYGAYNVVDKLSSDVLAEVKEQGDKIDLVPTLGPNQVTTGSLMDRMMNKDATKTYNQGSDSLQAFSDRMGGT